MFYHWNDQNTEKHLNSLDITFPYRQPSTDCTLYAQHFASEACSEQRHSNGVQAAESQNIGVWGCEPNGKSKFISKREAGVWGESFGAF